MNINRISCEAQRDGEVASSGGDDLSAGLTPPRLLWRSIRATCKKEKQLLNWRIKTLHAVCMEATECNTVDQGCHHLSCRAEIHQSVCVCVFPTGASPSVSPPGSDHRAVVPLHRRSSGGTTQVQEGVVQRDALRCRVCGHQPRQRCILPPCDVMLQCL